MQLLAVDPGINHCGVSLWDHEGFLVRAALVKNYVGSESSDGMRFTTMASAVGDFLDASPPVMVDTLFVEKMKVYAKSKQKGRPEDLLKVAGVSGAIIHEVNTRYPNMTFEMQLAAEWKGQESKEATEFKMRRDLSNEELSRVELPSASSLGHNVWDAVGIGYRFLKRSRVRCGPRPPGLPPERPRT